METHSIVRKGEVNNELFILTKEYDEVYVNDEDFVNNDIDSDNI